LAIREKEVDYITVHRSQQVKYNLSLLMVGEEQFSCCGLEDVPPQGRQPSPQNDHNRRDEAPLPSGRHEARKLTASG
jgi:hypothetical protein